MDKDGCIYHLPWKTYEIAFLGHSVETNLKHYSFAGKDNMDELKALLNGQASSESNRKVVDFPKGKMTGIL